jgi:hypothetical protein
MCAYESPLSRTAPAIPSKPFGKVGSKPHIVTINNLRIELEQWLQHGIPIPENPPLEEVGKSLGDLVLHVNARRNRKDIVELL